MHSTQQQKGAHTLLRRSLLVSAALPPPACRTGPRAPPCLLPPPLPPRRGGGERARSGAGGLGAAAAAHSTAARRRGSSGGSGAATTSACTDGLGGCRKAPPASRRLVAGARAAISAVSGRAAAEGWPTGVQVCAPQTATRGGAAAHACSPLTLPPCMHAAARRRCALPRRRPFKVCGLAPPAPILVCPPASLQAASSPRSHACHRLNPSDCRDRGPVSAERPPPPDPGPECHETRDDRAGQLSGAA